MKVWSKGLGQIVLNMDLRRYYVELDDSGELLIKGKITDPVLWKFKLSINKDDIPGLIHVLFKPKILIYIVKNSYEIFQYMFDKTFKKDSFLPED